MTYKTDHPFQPGVRVAIRAPHGFDDFGYREQFVDKLRKNGNFTLKGDPQQWRPGFDWGDNKRHCARPTNGRWNRQTLFLWDEKADAEVRESKERIDRRDRLYKLKGRFERLRFGDDITTDVLDRLESALPKEASKS